MAEKETEVKINFPERLHGGAYANSMFVNHTKEEFIMDFLMVAPPTGAVTARIIISPGHMKRIIAALQDNVKKYEESYGPVSAAEEPRGVGFRPPAKG